ncbi:hypothetical protein RJ640_025852 [Escallonia rubra]|uniref:Uncharacterized protein n=1 Tax=Escallonia rubra TaxID=112253 RepID=A0AA88U444_9ASTE|nr:hypothetical protein RJ640_025852 [Escallonia rubra]
MNKLRWAMDGGFWDVDVSTPMTLNGLARPVPGDPLPLGLSRGVRLSRPKQIDFFQRFMTMPFVPCFDQRHGTSLQRVFSFPFGQRCKYKGDEKYEMEAKKLSHTGGAYRFLTLLGQFNVQDFLSTIRTNEFMQASESSWMQSLGRHLCNKSLYAFDFCSELLITPDDTLLASVEAYADNKTPRKKAIFHHKASFFSSRLLHLITLPISDLTRLQIIALYVSKMHIPSQFPHHNLTVEAAWPGLFIDQDGTYWDVPFTTAIDLASVAADAGASYPMSVSTIMLQFEGQPTGSVAATLLPGLCAKGALSLKKNIDIWKSEAQKLKMVQPYDIFLSNPHISASGLLGAVVTASLGENSVRAPPENGSEGFKGFGLHYRGANSAILADVFASVSLSAQYGNFQRMFLDLTRFYGRLDFPSGANFVSGATCLASNFYNSQAPSLDAVQAICPSATLSLQQQRNSTRPRSLHILLLYHAIRRATRSEGSGGSGIEENLLITHSCAARFSSAPVIRAAKKITSTSAIFVKEMTETFPEELVITATIVTS